VENIILLEPNDDVARQVLFLLKLADFHCTHVRSVDEALNRISVSVGIMHPFELILLSSEVPILDGKTLVNEFLCGRVPALSYWQRWGTSLPEYFVEEIEIFPADQLIPCLHDYALKISTKNKGVKRCQVKQPKTRLK